MFAGGNAHYRVRIDLKRPIVGIGAPIHYFLPRAAAALGAEAALPPDADVANAIGAITSNIVVRRHVRIISDQTGGFLKGLTPPLRPLETNSWMFLSFWCKHSHLAGKGLFCGHDRLPPRIVRALGRLGSG